MNHHTPVIDNSFFRPLQYRNFFQYPPMRRLKPDDTSLAPSDLSLDEVSASRDYTIFVSIPFCRVRCNSCPYFVAFLPVHEDQEAFLDRYLARLERQIQQWASTHRFSSGCCQAVYIGGGTASLLSPRQVERVVHLLRRSFNFAEDAEITLEGNPREFRANYLQAVQHAGITRVSLGYQSSQETILRKTLNSLHTANESLRALQNALEVGFHTVNVDLLYRLPGQMFEEWQFDIATILSYEPTSVTMYEYVVHTGTASEGLIAKGRLGEQVDRETAHAWYLWAREQLLPRGYEELRHTTFSKPGHEQQYSYFTYGRGCELVGLGAKAYGFINGYQVAAPADVHQYESLVDRGVFPVMDKASPRATLCNLMERFVIFNLRRTSFVGAEAFRNRFGCNLNDIFAGQITMLTANGTLTVTSDGIKLTDLGMLWRHNVLEVFYDPALK